MLIIIVNIIGLLATTILYFVAKAGIKHYLDLYQNTSDVKKLNILTMGALIVAVLCVLLTCTLIITESRYNTNYAEVNHVIR